MLRSITMLSSLGFRASAFRGIGARSGAAPLQACVRHASRMPAAEPTLAFSSGPGEPIDCTAAVAFGVDDLRPAAITVAAPKAGEVRLRVVANALCHTDIYTLEGSDPEGLFPSILGHEAGTIVESVGAGVTSVKVGDKVIPCYTPQCKEADCIFCASPKTNLCPKIRSTQGAGVMPDGTVRFKLKDCGTPLNHFMGCSTFAEYTVVCEISCAVVDDAADLEQVCMLGCGVATGWGAVWKTTDVEEGASVAVFGLGAVGLAVIQAAKARGARRIFAIDTNPDKEKIAAEFGATDFFNPSDSETPIQQRLVEETTWGVDFTFDCTGNVNVMRSALEASHRGWGVSCVIGVAAAGHELATRPFQLVTGRTWKGKGPRRPERRFLLESYTVGYRRHGLRRLQVPGRRSGPRRPRPRQGAPHRRVHHAPHERRRADQRRRRRPPLRRLPPRRRHLLNKTYRGPPTP